MCLFPSHTLEHDSFCAVLELHYDIGDTGKINFIGGAEVTFQRIAPGGLIQCQPGILFAKGRSSILILQH